MASTALLVTALLALGPPPDGEVRVRSDHRELRVGEERYRLVSGVAPLTAVVTAPKGKDKRLVVEVVRIGRASDGGRGVPLVVTVGGRRHVLPNRPALVAERPVSGEDTIASWPVRYPLVIPSGRRVPVRVALRNPRSGDKVGIALVVADRSDTGLAPLTAARATRAAEKPRAKPVLAAAATRARADAGVDDDADPSDAPVDAGPGAADGGAAASVDTPVPEVVLPPPRQVPVRITFVDETSDIFVPEERAVTIDERAVLDEWGDIEKKSRVIFDGTLDEGAHALSVRASFAGSGGLFFSYIDEYTFHVSDVVIFDAEPDVPLEVRVRAFEQGGMFSELEDRPAIEVTTTARPR